MFNILRGMVQKDGGLRSHVQNYKFLGQGVCASAFYILAGSSKTMVSKLVDSLLAGAEVPADDGRSHRKERQKPCFEIVNAFFHWVYQHMAEPLAEGLADDVPEEMDDPTAAELELHPSISILTKNGSVLAIHLWPKASHRKRGSKGGFIPCPLPTFTSSSCTCTQTTLRRQLSARLFSTCAGRRTGRAR